MLAEEPLDSDVLPDPDFPLEESLEVVVESFELEELSLDSVARDPFEPPPVAEDFL